ncbi:MAG: response regulator transcription factor [Verrucomicrobia bacterium]|nr:response regulator transcription factor [Verrucomicrobiota bacterium]
MKTDSASQETTGAARRVKLLVVEDSPIVRKRLCALIERLPSVNLIGCAEDGSQGLELFRALQPEAVMLDLQLPGLSGFELLPVFKSERPDCPVIVLTTYADDIVRERCVRLGADHFFDKSREFEKAVELIGGMGGDPSGINSTAEEGKA